MSYRRSLGAVAENVDEGLRLPHAAERSSGSRRVSAGTARVRDPEGSRAAILDAATRIFASRGFVGASMRDISDASSFHKPLIYHHFGSKAGLYAAVKQNLAAECDRQGVGIDRSAERPTDLRAELWRLFEMFRANEALLRVCAWSRLEEGSTGGPEEMGVMKALRSRLVLAQEQRVIRSDIDPGNLSIMLVALVAFWLEGRSHLGGVFECGPDESAYLCQAVALVERGLALKHEFP
jgi:TetR/AcrR family transcriptional regulator